MSLMKSVALSLVLLGGIAGCNQQTVIENNYVDDSTQSRERTPAVINAELGANYLRQGNTKLALVKLQKSLKQDPKLADAHQYIAETYRRMGELALAESHYKRALTLQPYNSSIHHNYAVYLCDQARYEEAEKEFLTALENPAYTNRATGFQNLGLCMERVPDLAKAKQYFLKAVNTAYRLPPSHLALAKIYYMEQDYHTAKRYFEAFDDLSTQNADSLWLGINLAREYGDKNKEASYALLLKNKFPDSIQTLWLKQGKQGYSNE